MIYNNTYYDRESNTIGIEFLDDTINSIVTIEIPFDMMYQIKRDFEIMHKYHSREYKT